MKSLIGLILGLVLMVVAALFAGANDQLTHFDYLLGETQWPLSYLLLTSFLLGSGFVLLALIPVYLKSHTNKIMRNRQLKQLQAELDNLRVLPVQNNI